MREYDDQIAAASGTLTARAIAAMDSAEYHKRLARKRLDNVLANLRQLSASQKQSAVREARLWTALIADMIDPPLWQSIKVLVERKVVSAEINGVKHSYLEHHVMWATQVLNRVVLPMLAGIAR